MRVGSPPHTRGKGIETLYPENGYGITPAHAGKSIIRFTGIKHTGDHPRTRGEKHNLPPPIQTAWGSPPHTRGKVVISTDE